MRWGFIPTAIFALSIVAAAQSRNEATPKIADKKFWAVSALAAASTVSDVEVTAHALQNPTCREHNFLMGAHPSRAKMYGISVPATTGYALLGYWLKKHNVTLWAAPQLSLTGAHAVGSVLSSSCFSDVHYENLTDEPRPCYGQDFGRYVAGPTNRSGNLQRVRRRIQRIIPSQIPRAFPGFRCREWERSAASPA